jgi:hypothetical protein
MREIVRNAAAGVGSQFASYSVPGNAWCREKAIDLSRL